MTEQRKSGRRRLRNYLLEPSFQLKYTGIAVLGTLVVAGVLGYVTYDFSVAQSEMMTASALNYPGIEPEVVAEMTSAARDQDRRILWSIVGGVLLFTLVIGLLSIILTHKIVGPAHKIRMLIDHISAGNLRVAGSLRSGDELQPLFESFAQMVTQLREAQEDEVSELDRAIEEARAAGGNDDLVAPFERVRDRMRAVLE